MVKKPKVFISSTSKDLIAYRQAVKQVVEEFNMEPIVMEEFNPARHNALQFCYNEVQEADIFIGIYAYRYGYKPSTKITYKPYGSKDIKHGDGETGITHFEYLWALDNNIPMLLFIVSEENPIKLPDSDEDTKDKSRMKNFKHTLMESHVVNFFVKPEDLAEKTRKALKNITTLPNELRNYFDAIKRRNTDDYIELSGIATFKPIQIDHNISENPQQTKDQFTKITKILSKYKEFVLLGDAGSGKTTTLVYLEHWARISYSTEKRIPIFIKLSQWLSKEQSFLEYLQQHWKESELPGSIEDQSILLLLDGLNEIPQYKLSQIKELRELLKPHENELANDWQVVITCRQNDYADALDLGISRVNINSLSHEQIIHYLNSRDSSELAQYLASEISSDDRNSLSEFVRNPFMLKILTDTYIQQAAAYGSDVALREIIGNQGKLFSQWIKFLWEREQNKELRPSYHHLVPPTDMMAYVFSELAFHVIDEDRGTSVDVDFAIASMPKYFEEHDTKSSFLSMFKQQRVEVDKPFILRLAESASLLNEINGELPIQFKHQLILEYFGALALQKKTNLDPKALSKIIKPYLSTTRDGRRRARKWDNSLVMLAGLVEDTEQFLEIIFSIDPFLVSEILPSISVTQETRQKYLDYYLNIIEMREEHIILAIDALSKLPDLKSLTILAQLDFERKHWKGGKIHQSIYRAYQNIADTFGLQRALEHFPTALDIYPSETIVWVWILHNDTEKYFSFVFLPLNLLIDPDDDIQDTLYTDTRIHYMKSCAISDAKSTIPLLKACWINHELKARTIVLGVLCYLKHPDVTQFMLNLMKSFENSDNYYDIYKIVDYFLQNTSTKLDDVLIALKLPKIAPILINILGGTHALAHTTALEIPEHLTTIYQSAEVAQHVLEITKLPLLEDYFIKKFHILGRAIRLLNEVPDTVSVSALVELFVHSSDEQRIQESASQYIQRKPNGIYISQELENQLIEMVDTGGYAGKLAGKILGKLQATDPQILLSDISTHALAIAELAKSDTRNSALLKQELLNFFQDHKHGQVALALGILKVESAIPHIIDAIDRAIATHFNKSVRITDCIKALQEIGIADERTIGVLERIVKWKPAPGTDKYSLHKYWSVSHLSAQLLYNFVGEESMDAISIALRHVTMIETEYIHDTTWRDLAELLSTLISQSKNDRASELITYVHHIMHYEQELAKDQSPIADYERGQFRQTYEHSIHLLGNLENHLFVPVFKEILNIKFARYIWEDVIQYLQKIGDDETVHVLCEIYSNRRDLDGEYNPDGMYEQAEHDKLCALATQAIIEIGTESGFEIFITNINQQLKDEPETNFYDFMYEKLYWLSNVKSELQSLSNQGFQIFMKLCFTLEIAPHVQKWLTQDFGWTRPRLDILNQVILQIQYPPQYAHDLLKTITKELADSPARITKQTLPSLGECIERISRHL